MKTEFRNTPWILRRAVATPTSEALVWREPSDGSPGEQRRTRLGAPQSLDYAGLAERSREAALALRQLGVREGDVVALLLPNGPAFVVLVHALQRCNALLLPVNLRATAAELAFQLEDAGARFILHEPRTSRAEGFGSAAGGVHAIGVRTAEGARLHFAAESGLPCVPCDTPLCERVPLERPLALLFTSGTTGRPKAAIASAASFWHAARASADRLGGEPTDRWLACMPLFHVGGLSIVLRSVLIGSSLLVHPRFDAEAVAEELDADRVTLASFVPNMLARVLAERGERRSPPRLRAVLLGGGPAPLSLLQRARSLGYPIAPTYGLTEACSQVATRSPAEQRAPLDGRLAPLDGVRIRIVDRDGRELGPGEEGEILVRGPNVMDGYWRRPDATREALRDGWLHTGDIGRLDEEGCLQVLDRRSDLIVSGGENVYPAEVEAVLLAHPDVREAAVVAVTDPEFGARPLALVVLAAGAARDADELRRHCRERLAAYKVPVRIEWRSELPRTAAGKLRRALLRSELASSSAS